MVKYKRQILTTMCMYALVGALLILGFSTRAQAQELPTVERDGGDSVEVATPAEASVGSYLVQPGDTLSQIAVLQLGTSVDYLASYNNIPEPDVIYSGQTLYFELQEGFSPPAAAEDNSEEAMMEGEEGAEEEGKRPDEPDKAAALRFQQNKNEKGVIPRGALVRAAKKADNMKHKPVPGTKGVSRTATDTSQPSSTDSTQPSSTDTTQGTAGTVQPSTANIDRNLWKWRGPGNVGGRLRSIVIHPNNPQIMWAGSVGGGIWKTTDGGASWNPLDDFMANLAVSTLVIDPKNPNVLYAGTGEGFYQNDALRGAGVFKSTDGGITWNQLSSTNTSDFQWVNRLTISPNNSQALLAATRTGIWRSSDGGTTWTPKLPANGGFLQVAFNPNDGTKVVASGKYGRAYYSTDGGYTWSAAAKPWGGGNQYYDARVEISYAPSNPNIVYASVNQERQATDGKYYAGLIYKSTDGGRTYGQMSQYLYGYLGDQGWYDNAIWVSPTNPNFLIVGGVDLFRSTDGGATLTRISKWQSSPDSSAHGDQHAIVSSPNFNGTTNKTVFFGNDGGIYKAQDASTVAETIGWQELNNNLGVTQFYGGAGSVASGTIVGGTQDNGSLTGKGSTEGWTTMFGGDGGFAAADPTNSNYFYGEYTHLNVHRSSNGGTSSSYISGCVWNGDVCVWKPAPYTIPDAKNNTALFIAPFVLDPNNSNRMLAGGQSLWRTNDVKTPNTNSSGPSWASIKGPLTGAKISAIAVAPGNSNIIWVGYNNGLVYKTTNGTSASPAWTRVDTASMPGDFALRITIDPRNSNIVYATFGGFSPDNVWRTTDGGSTWREITGSGDTGLPDAPVRSLAIHPNNSNWLYVGTEVGVFASEDGGAHWATATDGPANVSVDELFWQGTRLFAATHGRGMYETDTQAVRPANDNFTNAQGLTGANATATGTNANASKETGEPAHWTNNPAGKSVWYKWTPQANGTATIDTAGSAFDTVLAVYTGSAVNTLTQIDQNDDGPNLGQQSKLDFQATAGTTYRIAVDGYDNGLGNESGNIKLNLASDAPPPVDTTNPTATLTAPADNAVIKGTAVTLSADASDNVGVSKVEFLVGGQVVATDNSAPYSTSWDSTAKSDGFANVTARAFDAAGNTGTSGIRKVAVNNTTPDTTITGGPADGSTTANTTASFTFSSTENDSTFRCKLDDATFADCTSPKDYANLVGGSHTFQVKAVGSGGEANDTDTTPASRIWTVNPSTCAEATSSSEGVTSANGKITGTSGDNLIVGTDADETLNGLEGNDTLCGKDGFDTLSGGPGTDTLDGGAGDNALEYGRSTTGVNVDLPAGTVTGEGADTLSGTFTEVYGSVQNDTIKGNEKVNHLYGNNGSDTISGMGGNDTITGGTGTDNLYGGDGSDTIKAQDGVKDTIDCGADTDGADKDTVYADAVDTTTNCETVIKPPDTTAPNTSINSGPSGTVRSTTASFYFSSSEAGSTFQCSLDGRAFGACASPKSYTSLSNGTHNFRVRAIDAAGNVDASPAARSWRVDTIKPTISKISPKRFTRDQTPTIRATVRDNTNLSKRNIKLVVNGKRVSNRKFSYSRSRDQLSYTVRPKQPRGKRVSVKIVARDGAGNPARKAWSFKIR